MPSIDLHYVDELIQVRQAQHGGGRGAPRLQGQHRVGVSINRSCVVMLSALLQSFVEEVFKDAAKRAFPALNANENAFDSYWRQTKNWGNPSDANIKNLFLRIGVPDVFVGLSWQRMKTDAVRSRLDELNQLRNKIAHGSKQLSVNNQPYSLKLANVHTLRNFSECFADRFVPHVRNLVP